MNRYIAHYRPYPETILTVTWNHLAIGALDVTGKITMTKLEHGIFNDMLDTDQLEKTGEFMRFEIQEGEESDA